jgi:hypothetical protein
MLHEVEASTAKRARQNGARGERKFIEVLREVLEVGFSAKV